MYNLLNKSTLNAICSKKWAAPLFFSFSALLPALIHTPTVAVCANTLVSVATVNPFGSTVERVIGWGKEASEANERVNYNFYFDYKCTNDDNLLYV